MRCESLTRIPCGRWQCAVCGRVSPKATDEMPHMQCGEERKRKPLAPGMVGIAAQRIIGNLGLSRVPSSCVSCAGMIAQMNALGVDGCREHRSEIVAHLKAAYRETSWADFAAASAKAIASGLAFKLNPLDPFGSLVDEAIRLAGSRHDQPQQD